MLNRSIKIENKLFTFYKNLPPNLLTFSVDIFAILKTIPNCFIYSYKEFADMNNIKISDIICYCKSESGCCFLRNGKYVILYNDCNSICKQRIIFTLAHELGHIVLDHFNIYNISILSDNYNNHKLKNQIEDEAEYFAACFLCPLPILTKIPLKSEIEIQKVFNLSKSASVIAWRQLINYDRTLNIACHNKFLKLFSDFISNYNNKLG